MREILHDFYADDDPDAPPVQSVSVERDDAGVITAVIVTRRDGSEIAFDADGNLR